VEKEKYCPFIDGTCKEDGCGLYVVTVDEREFIGACGIAEIAYQLFKQSSDRD
jgi:hypothetical protein